MAQQDEFEAKAMVLCESWRSSRDGIPVLHERIADALRAEHTRGDAAGYIRGQIEALEWVLPKRLWDYDIAVLDRIAELRKAGT